MLCIINAYRPGEISVPQSQPLSYQAVTTTATGKPLFSATFGSITTGSTVQALNVFNPANSGVSYTFHSARLYTNDNTGLAQGNLILLSGADLNLGTAVSAVSHDGNANPRVSTAHVTAEDIGSAHGGTVIETIDAQTAVINDFLAFPDNYTLAPGNNLRIRQWYYRSCCEAHYQMVRGCTTAPYLGGRWGAISSCHPFKKPCKRDRDSYRTSLA